MTFKRSGKKPPRWVLQDEKEWLYSRKKIPSSFAFLIFVSPLSCHTGEGVGVEALMIVQFRRPGEHLERTSKIEDFDVVKDKMATLRLAIALSAKFAQAGSWAV